MRGRGKKKNWWRYAENAKRQLCVALATALRFFSNADGNQCHVPGRHLSPPENEKMVVCGGDGGDGRTKTDADKLRLLVFLLYVSPVFAAFL